MAMSMLKGLKDAVSKPQLKAAGTAMLGGGVAGLGHLLLATKVSFVASSWWRRALAAGLIGTVGAYYVGKKWPKAAPGVSGAMGSAVAIELYGQFGSSGAAVTVPAVKGLRGLIGRLGNGAVMLPANSGAYGATSKPLMAMGGVSMPSMQGATTQAMLQGLGTTRTIGMQGLRGAAVRLAG